MERTRVSKAYDKIAAGLDDVLAGRYTVVRHGDEPVPPPAAETESEAVARALAEQEGFSGDAAVSERFLRRAAAALLTAARVRPVDVSEADAIKRMTDRFLQWKLPDDFAPDGGISAARPSYTPDVRWEPTGTNLLDARQATDMVRFIVGEDIPMLADTPPGRGEWFDLERRWRDKHDELRARAEKAEAERDSFKDLYTLALTERDASRAQAEALATALVKARPILDYFANDRQEFSGSGTPKQCLREIDAALAAYQPVSQSAAGAQELLGIGDEDGAIYGVHYGNDDVGNTTTGGAKAEDDVAGEAHLDFDELVACAQRDAALAKGGE